MYCVCACLFFLYAAVLGFFCCVSAGFLPQAQGGDGEDRHHPHQRERRQDQGPGKCQGWLFLVFIVYMFLYVIFKSDAKSNLTRKDDKMDI